MFGGVGWCYLFMFCVILCEVFVIYGVGIGMGGRGMVLLGLGLCVWFILSIKLCKFMNRWMSLEGGNYSKYGKVVFDS